MDFDLHGMRYSVINVYAPCQGQDRQAFASHLQAILPTDGRTVLMGGDFNCIDTQYDAIPCPNPRSRRFVGATDFAIITTSATLTDTCRHLHPAPCLGFTHTNTSRDGASRLDRWYATHALMGCTTTASFVDGLPGDHRGIHFSFTPPGAIVRQRPPWRLPFWLLADREFMTSFRRGSTQLQANRLHAQDSTRSAHEFLQALAHPTAQNPSNHPQSQETPTPTDDDPAGLLEDLIACFRACAQRREGLDRAASRHERQRLEGEVNMALAQLDPSASHPQPSLIAHQRAHTALATHAQIASGTAAARAAAVARTFHESGTHHFHTTYGSHHHQDVLFHSVTDTTANTTFAIDTPAQLQRGKDIAASALTKLFGQRPVDHFAQDRLLSHLDTTITTEAATAMGSPLTLSDMHNAARALQRNKSPGLDGIPVEAYLALWEVFGQVLTNAFNACHQASPCCLSPRQRTSDYTLIPKATTPSDPGSRRPIAGVNTDVRICARAITTRLATALQPVVDATQTGFLPGRWIGDNILAHTELSEYLARNNAPGCMLFLDFSKAFDYVDRGWILRVMAALGSTAAGQHWARLFLTDTLGRARVNGAPSCTFRVISGCPQGNPISRCYTSFRASRSLPISAISKIQASSVPSASQPEFPPHSATNTPTTPASTPPPLRIATPLFRNPSASSVLRREPSSMRLKPKPCALVLPVPIHHKPATSQASCTTPPPPMPSTLASSWAEVPQPMPQGPPKSMLSFILCAPPSAVGQTTVSLTLLAVRWQSNACNPRLSTSAASSLSPQTP